MDHISLGSEINQGEIEAQMDSASPIVVPPSVSLTPVSIDDHNAIFIMVFLNRIFQER